MAEANILNQERRQSDLIAENRGQSDDRESLSYEKPIKPLERRGASRASGTRNSVGRERESNPHSQRRLIYSSPPVRGTWQSSPGRNSWIPQRRVRRVSRPSQESSEG